MSLGLTLSILLMILFVEFVLLFVHHTNWAEAVRALRFKVELERRKRLQKVEALEQEQAILEQEIEDLRGRISSLGGTPEGEAGQ